MIWYRKMPYLFTSVASHRKMPYVKSADLISKRSFSRADLDNVILIRIGRITP